MKKISLRGISEILSEKELKNVVGGGSITETCNAATNSGCSSVSCTQSNGSSGTCNYEKNSFGIVQCRCS